MFNKNQNLRQRAYWAAAAFCSLLLFAGWLHAKNSGTASYHFNAPAATLTGPMNRARLPAAPLPGQTNKPATALLKKVFLPAPFTPQAPTANWDELHNEACEEAVAIMAASYFSSSAQASLAPDTIETELAKLTAWQDKTLGYHLDTTSAETARMMEAVYGLHTRLLNNFTEQDIKLALSAGRLVAISENGRRLNNPYYKQPGPIHHMLLLKGYDPDGTIITNDSGTKRGLNYPYDFPTLYAAAADWDHTAGSVDENKKIAIEIWK